MAQQHTLFLACTRPALIAGIPIEAFVVSGLFCIESFMISGLFTTSVWRLVWLGGSLGISYLVCRLLTAIDHNIFHILFVWFQTKCRTSRNAAYWGGSSLSPAPIRRARKAQDIPYLG